MHYIRAEGDLTISGLKESFIQRYIVERTNKTRGETERTESEKTESCENLWNEIQLEGSYRQKVKQEQNKKERASSVSLCQRRKSPPRKGEPTGTVTCNNPGLFFLKTFCFKVRWCDK